jgi:subtilisin family serine protease
VSRPGLFRIITVLCVFSLLLTGLVWTAPVSAGNEAQPVSKVGSLLSLRLQLKLQQQQLAQSGYQSQSQSLTSPVDILAADGTTDLNSEKVFLRFANEPSLEQISDLASEGIVVYPDSWIPPVGVFKTGIILADLPVDRLDALAARDYILNIDTAEERSFPQNDLARETMNVGPVWTGGDTGAGVTVAVLDSGIDASNPDFPALNFINSRDYSAYPDLDYIINNAVTGHGTHVAGSVLGRGVNCASYKGVAPGADLVFLKIGNDVSSGATSAAIEGALRDAVNVYQADIITMSYGGLSSHHDGSDEMCQAVDYAVSRGVTVFMSAGNNAAHGWHYSGTVPAGSTSDFIQVNVTGAGVNDTELFYNLVWFDGPGMSNHLSLQYYDSAQNPMSDISTGVQSESLRGTEDVYSNYQYSLPPGNGTYYLKVQNTSPNPQFFHIYYDWGSTAVTFANPDPNYTIGSPGEADGAIAVGAFVTRKNWEDFQGQSQTNSSQTVGVIATFSSRGPRVDSGAPLKPDIAAPGSVIISARDNDVYPWPGYNTAADAYPYQRLIIDNDGLDLDGSGPADYFVMQGTSMACPLAAGVAALMLSKNAYLTPLQVKQVLQYTAVDKGRPGFDNIYGGGLINARTAVSYAASVNVTSIGGEIQSVDKTVVLIRSTAAASAAFIALLFCLIIVVRSRRYKAGILQ